MKASGLLIALLMTLGTSPARAASEGAGADAEPYRVWTDSTGKYHVQAALLYWDKSTGTVYLLRPDGRRVRCKFERLCRRDQQRVEAGFGAGPSAVCAQGGALGAAGRPVAHDPVRTLLRYLSRRLGSPAIQYRPVTAEQLRRAKARLRQMAARLEHTLARWGRVGQEWKDYLRWDLLEAQLAADRPVDCQQLREVYDQMAGDQVGLERKVFQDVRRAMAEYLRAAQQAASPDAPHRFQARARELAATLAAIDGAPTAEQLELISRDVAWLAERGQAPWEVRAIGQLYGRPNVYVDLSRRLLAAGLARRVDEPVQVRDWILGTAIYGSGRMVGQVGLSLVPHPRRGLVDLVFRGSIGADTVGYNDPVRITSSGTTRIVARTRIVVTPAGLQPLPTRSAARTATQITGLSTRLSGLLDWIARWIAWTRISQDKAAADAIAAHHAAARFNARMDRRLEDLARQSNARYRQQIRNPLVRRDLFPRQVRIATTANALRIKLLQANRFQLGAPGPPPAVAGSPDLAVRLHQSAANNLFSALLAGKTTTGEQIGSRISQWFGGSVPPSVPESQQIAVTLDDQQPVTLRIDDGVLGLTVRGSRFVTRGRSWPAMNVTVRYRVDNARRGVRLTWLGAPIIQPPRFDGGGLRELSAREVLLRRLLANRLARDLQKEIVLERLSLPEPFRQLGQLSVARLDADDGWLLVGLQRTGAQPERTESN